MRIACWFAGAEPRQSALVKALVAHCQKQCPQAVVESVDVLERYGRRLARALLREGESWSWEAIPQLWARLERQGRFWQSKSIQRLSMAWDHKALTRDLERKAPDLILVLHPLALLPLALQRREAERESLVIALPTSLAHSEAWVQPGVNAFASPFPVLSRTLVTQGVSPEMIPSYVPSLWGAPDAETLASWKAEAQDEALTWSFDRERQRCIFLSVSSLEAYESADLLFQLSLVKGELLWLFDVGDNDAVAEALRLGVQHHALWAKRIRDRAGQRTAILMADRVLAPVSDPHWWRSLCLASPTISLLPHAAHHKREAEAWQKTGAAEVITSWEQTALQIELSLSPRSLVRARALLSSDDEKTLPSLGSLCANLLKEKELWKQRERDDYQRRWSGEAGQAATFDTSQNTQVPASGQQGSVESWGEPTRKGTSRSVAAVSPLTSAASRPAMSKPSEEELELALAALKRKLAKQHTIEQHDLSDLEDEEL